ncbi:MAG: CRISPR-associated helicase, Cas3 family [Verrucomicrobiales bacterium]|nr:CRISPR-associated helicase, Cas3 family [Verrucomicrobiales bacterium]
MTPVLTSSNINLVDCWAKTWTDGPLNGRPGLTVYDHCLNVGAVAVELLGKLPRPVRETLPPGAHLLVAVHDIGKITPGFLRKCEFWKCHEPRSATQGETDHARVSQWFLAGLPEMRDPRGRPTDWLLAAGGHHGRYPSSKADLPGIREFAQSDWPLTLRRELLAELIELFGSPPAELVFLRHGDIRTSARVHLLTGFTTFCDWLGSDEKTFPLSAEFPPACPATLPASRKAAAGSLAAIGSHQREVTAGMGFAELFADDSGTVFSPRPLQSTLMAAMDAPGLYIVEAPMGMGKTEAALAAAYARWTTADAERGLYFALPTQLTSQRIHQRVAAFLKNIISDKATLTLVHGNAWLSADRVLQLSPTNDSHEDQGAADAHGWFASTTRRALLAPFGTGTIDQALLSVLPAKHAALRFFALAGKVIVLDEVHSYDPYTSALVDRAIQWLLHAGCSVLVLSATLTAARRAALVAAAGAVENGFSKDYPLITKVSSGSQEAVHIPVDGEVPRRLTVSLKHLPAGDPDIQERAVEAAARGACVLIIRNTVALAQETYRLIKSARCGDAFQVGLLHSRFPQWQRDEQEKKWTTLLGNHQEGRPRGCVLVATQVVEQSVDIDSDLLITDLAPTDLLLQRIGRLHRHDRSRPDGFAEPRCLILYPRVDWSADAKVIRRELSPHGYVYPPYALYRAQALWRERETVSLPGDIRPLLEATYADAADLPVGVSGLHRELASKVEKMVGTAASRGVFTAVATADREGAETRWIEQDTALVVLLPAAPVESGSSRITVTLHGGSTLHADTSRFHMDLAQALHLHAVRVPRYLIAPALARQKPWFKFHINDAVLAVCPPETSSCLIPEASDNMAFLQYHPDTGLTYTKPEKSSASADLSAFEEDGWF